MTPRVFRAHKAGLQPEKIIAAERDAEENAGGGQDFDPWLAALGLEWAEFPEDRSCTLRGAA